MEGVIRFISCEPDVTP